MVKLQATVKLKQAITHIEKNEFNEARLLISDIYHALLTNCIDADSVSEINVNAKMLKPKSLK